MSEIIDSTLAPSGQMSLWDKATQRAPIATFQHRRVLNSKTEFNKAALKGVPFIITGIAYRPGDEETGPYVSLECTIGPREAIHENAQGGRIPYVRTVDAWIESFHLQPGEEIVINDGGKGIMRQMTQELHKTGYIVVHPEARSRSDFDLEWTRWTSCTQWEETTTDDGETWRYPHFTTDHDGNPLLMVAFHGLRASKDPDAPDSYSETYYLS